MSPETAEAKPQQPAIRSADTVKIAPSKKLIQSFCWRGSQSEYLIGKFSQRFVLLMVEEVIWMAQSESDGKICVTLLYR